MYEENETQEYTYNSEKGCYELVIIMSPSNEDD